MIHGEWGPCPGCCASEGLAGPSESRPSLMWVPVSGIAYLEISQGYFPRQCLDLTGPEQVESWCALKLDQDSWWFQFLLLLLVLANLLATRRESTRCPKEPLTSTLHPWSYPGLVGQTQVPKEWPGEQIAPAGYHSVCFMGFCETGPPEWYQYADFWRPSLMLDTEWIHVSGPLTVYWRVCLTCVGVCVSWCVFDLQCCLWSTVAGQQRWWPGSFLLCTSSSLATRQSLHLLCSPGDKCVLVPGVGCAYTHWELLGLLLCKAISPSYQCPLLVWWCALPDGLKSSRMRGRHSLWRWDESSLPMHWPVSTSLWEVVHGR